MALIKLDGSFFNCVLGLIGNLGADKQGAPGKRSAARSRENTGQHLFAALLRGKTTRFPRASFRFHRKFAQLSRINCYCFNVAFVSLFYVAVSLYDEVHSDMKESDEMTFCGKTLITVVYN